MRTRAVLLAGMFMVIGSPLDAQFSQTIQPELVTPSRAVIAQAYSYYRAPAQRGTLLRSPMQQGSSSVFTPDTTKLIGDYYLQIGDPGSPPDPSYIDDSAFCRCTKWRSIKVLSITPRPAGLGEALLEVRIQDAVGPAKSVTFRMARWINKVLISDIQLANGKWMRAEMIRQIKAEKANDPNAY